MNQKQSRTATALGIHTVDEVAEALGVPSIALARLVTLGRLPFHQNGRGEMILFAADVERFVGQGLNGVGEMPPTRDGWFEPQSGAVTGPEFQQRLRAAAGKVQAPPPPADPLEAALALPANFAATQMQTQVAVSHLRGVYHNYGPSMLRTELRSHARYQIGQLKNTRHRSPIEQLYRLGPDRFRELLAKCTSRLETMTFGVKNKRLNLAAISGGAFAGDLKTQAANAF